MGRRSRKLNFLVEESICRSLESLVPVGKRSKVVNQALRKELELIRRERVLERLVAVSQKGKRFSSKELVDGVAKGRRGH